jgi:hypothetical protein
MRYKKDPVNVSEALQLLQDGLSYQEVANKYNVSKQAIYYVAKKHGTKSKIVKKSDWSDSEINIIKEKYSLTSIDDLVKLLPARSESSIRRKAHELGCKKEYIYKHQQPKSSLSVLLDSSLETFYWMGFILADGWVSKDLLTLGMSLAEKDKDHLYKYAEYIKCRNIQTSTFCNRHLEGINNNTSEIVRIASRDKDLVPRIAGKFGFTCKKTHLPPEIEKYDNFNVNQLMALFVGYIDGDGSIYIDKSKGYTSPRLSIEAISSWDQFFHYLKDRFISELGVELNECTYRQRENRSKLCCFRTGRKGTLRFLLKFINKHNLPVLERKWGKLRELYQEEAAMK